LLGATVLLMIFAYSGARLNRVEGGVMLSAYIGYILWTADLI
jgi:cation:H+ antiporter